MAWAPVYVDTSEARAYITRHSSQVDDVEIDFAVAAASRAIDLHTHRQFGKVDAPESRIYPVEWNRRRNRYVVEIDDLMTTAGLEIGGVAYDPGVHRLEPRNAPALGRPWTSLVLGDSPGDEVTITATWGWTTIPAAVKQATLLQANRLFARRESPFGVAGSPEVGSELRLLARVDPDVAVVLGPYVRWWGAR